MSLSAKTSQFGVVRRGERIIWDVPPHCDENGIFTIMAYEVEEGDVCKMCKRHVTDIKVGERWISIEDQNGVYLLCNNDHDYGIIVSTVATDELDDSDVCKLCHRRAKDVKSCEQWTKRRNDQGVYLLCNLHVE